MNFSQRMGLEPVTQPFQTNSMSNSLRVGLWNAFHLTVTVRIQREWQLHCNETDRSQFSGLFLRLWGHFFKWPVDTLPVHTDRVLETIRAWYLDSKTPWNRVYEFIEFIATDRDISDAEEFRDFCNGVLVAEWSGYRFVGDHLAPLTNPVEIDAIEDAAAKDGTLLAPVSIHIKEAVRLLADKANPDYRNSMKESISAVEAVCRIIAAKPNTTLSPALDAIKSQIGLHSDLSDGLKKLYWYTSDTGGIRHALKDTTTPEAEDAKFLLVTCAAFVNYLVEKARKANLIPK